MIPTLSSKILGKVHKDKKRRSKRQELLRDLEARQFHPAELTAVAGGLIDYTTRFIYSMCGLFTARIGLALIMPLLALGLAYFLMPKTKYLPEGNREILFGVLLPPPGYNLAELEKIRETIKKDILPLIEHDKKSELAEN